MKKMGTGQLAGWWAAHERLGQALAQAAGSWPHSRLLSRFRMASEGSAPVALPQASGSDPAIALPLAASTRSCGSAPGAPHASGSAPVAGTQLPHLSLDKSHKLWRPVQDTPFHVRACWWEVAANDLQWQVHAWPVRECSTR